MQPDDRRHRTSCLLAGVPGSPWPRISTTSSADVTSGVMKLSMMINYSGDFHADVRRVTELEAAGLDVVWIPEAYSFDAISQIGYLAAKTERVEIGTGIVNVYSRHRRVHGPDRGRLRLRERRAVHPRPRRVRPAGDRGLPRRAVREADAAHPRLHQRGPHDTAPRACRVRRPDGDDPAARGRGHRSRQAAEDHQPSGARHHPDLLGEPDGPERRQHRAVRRRLAAGVLRSREVPRRVGRRDQGRARPSATRRSASCRSRPAGWWRSARS